MTDAEIDKLSGRELDEAVCLQLGWTKVLATDGSPIWIIQSGEAKVDVEFHSNLGEVLRLLLECKGVRVDVTLMKSGETVNDASEWLCGTQDIHLLPTVCCRAWLKLQQRKGARSPRMG